MSIFLTVIHVFVCFVLIVVILIQGGRGQGLTGGSFASGNVQSLFGTRAADFLTKATSVSAICFLFTCIGLNLLEAHKSRSLLETRTQAPVDVDAIQKALEKIQADEEAAKKEIAPEAAKAATDEDAVGVTTQLQDEAGKIVAENIKNEPEPSVPSPEDAAAPKAAAEKPAA